MKKSYIIRQRGINFLSFFLTLLVCLLATGAQAQSCPCEGRISELFLRYDVNATSNTLITAYYDKYFTQQISSQEVAPGEVAAFYASDIGLERFGPKTYFVLSASANSYTVIHTSCSVNTYGETYDELTVVGQADYAGNICREKASLGNKVFEDANANGIQDIGEWGVSGVILTLRNEAGTRIDQVVSDANGLYLFENIDDGTYYIEVSNLPSGYVTTYNDQGEDLVDSDVLHLSNRTELITLLPGAHDSSVDVGLLAESSFPVEWLHLEVEQAGNHARLHWSTARELNNDYFEIERSVDQQEFSSIGKVTGAGNTQQARSYEFADQDISLTGYEQVFYRIKQVDFDGNFSYSNILELSFNYDTELAVYPNPAKDNFHISFQASGKTSKLRVYNAIGQEVYQQILPSGTGKQTLTISILDWAPGAYYLRLANQPNSQIRKLIVK